jgi:glycosyltransferase involved in cell wall biosynthesis
MPAYNGEKVIEDSIESVLDQIYAPIELIIIDDASGDDTFAKMKKHEHDNRVASFKAIKHERNEGLAATLNHGLKESSGRYLAILHQDCVLMDKDWLSKALEYFFSDEKIAVVTGYYGIPPENLTFVTKAFGVFRRQYHAINPKQMDEEVTFSEGKCDMYRKDVLEKIGGFPERFRIAGEDLYVSYKIRQSGCSIVKSYKLPVVQKFGPAADSLSKNLKKEFVFGKAMGGIFPMFGTFLFKKMNASEYSRTRSLQRATQPLFVLFFILLLLLAAIFRNTLIFYSALAILGIRYFLYVITIWGELRRMSDLFHKTATVSFFEALVIAALGVLIDFAYTLGFGYGLVLYTIGARL